MILLWLVVFAIIGFVQNSSWVEKYYSCKMYVYISTTLRFISSIFPFSIGDVLYIILATYLLWRIIKFVKNIFTSKEKKEVLITAIRKVIQFILIIFIVFKLFWGLNYSRQGIAKQFDLSKYNYTKEELLNLTTSLIFDANNCRKQIADTVLPQLGIDSIFRETKECYVKINKQYNFLYNKPFCLKPSLYSVAGNYFGYTGYYNPFTGEAQVRSDIPQILLPFICCHEVAHQVGYASEEEANFVACIVANESNNITFKYSLDLELLDYASRELAIKFLEEGKLNELLPTLYSLQDCMSKQVKKDRKAIKDFFNINRKDIADYSNKMFDKYLKLNHQNKGITSYNEVIAWLLAYRNKFKVN